MMTRKIIKKILPNALPLAILLISVAMPHPSFADDAVSKKTTSKSSSSSKKASKSSDSSADAKEKDSAKPAKDAENTNDGARVKEFVYSESNVYVIRTKYGYQTNIVFDSKEEVQTISVGDRSLWQIIPAGNRVYIRPMTDNLSTNMTLITNKHTYEFDLKSVTEKNDSNVYVVRFTYPDKNALMATDSMPYAAPTTPAAVYVPVESNIVPPPVSESPKQVVSEAASPASIGLLPIRYNYSYTYAGPDALAPLQVYDDGKTTFIKYKAIAQPLPETFSIDAGGKETRIPVAVKGSSLVVDGVANELALRSKDGEIRVYNESSSPR